MFVSYILYLSTIKVYLMSYFHKFANFFKLCLPPKVESLKTHFELLGLEAYKSPKMPCPRFENLFFGSRKRKITKEKLTLTSVCSSITFFCFKDRLKIKQTVRFLCDDLFLHHCVLDPWPRAFLFLASLRGFVL